MKLIIATKNYLATWDASVGLKQFLVDESPDNPSYFYGITQDPRTGAVYIGFTTAEGRCEIWRLSAGLEKRKKVCVLDGKPLAHQIMIDRGEMWICRCDQDAVEVRSLDGFGLVRQWRPFPSRNNLHLNSVNVIDNRIYVCAHNWARRPGEVFVLSRGLDFVGSMSVGTCIHNCWPDPKSRGLYVLSSKESKVYYCEPAMRRVITIPDSGFLRGVAATEEYTAIGSSTYGERDVRWKLDAEVIVVDRKWEVVERIRLPLAGQVYEVRSVSSADLAHAGRPVSLGSTP